MRARRARRAAHRARAGDRQPADTEPVRHRLRHVRHHRPAAGRLLPVRERRLAQDGDDSGRPCEHRLVHRPRGPLAGRAACDHRGGSRQAGRRAGLGRAARRRFLRELHGLGARRGARHHAAQGGARAHRGDQEQARSPRGVRASPAHRRAAAVGRLRRTGREEGRRVHRPGQPVRHRDARPRLLLLAGEEVRRHARRVRHVRRDADAPFG